MPAEFVHATAVRGRRVVSCRSAGTTVSFLHNWPSTFNVGDFLCSPRHYFDFTCLPPEESGFDRIAVVGGGAFNDLGGQAAVDCAGQRNVAWGIGRSIRFADRDQTMKPVADVFDVVGWRDPDLCAAGVNLVPCASVFHDITNVPPGPETGIFLNANPAASGAGVDGILGRKASFVTGTNALGEAELCARFARTGKIVTNSYHIAYWGLLSGREVAVIGYSTKFASLLELFGLPPATIEYERGNGDGLRRAVEETLRARSWLRLERPKQTKDALRSFNLAFAERLVRDRLFSSIRPVGSSPERTRRREVEIWSCYELSLRP